MTVMHFDPCDFFWNCFLKKSNYKTTLNIMQNNGLESKLTLGYQTKATNAVAEPCKMILTEL